MSDFYVTQIHALTEKTREFKSNNPYDRRHDDLCLATILALCNVAHEIGELRRAIKP